MAVYDSAMPEGHSIKHFANVHDKLFKGQKISAASPQGRFDASQIDGRTFSGTTTLGKHLFLWFDNEITVHVHLGLYGWFNISRGEAQQPKTTTRLRIQTDEYTSDLTAPTVCEIVDGDKMNEIYSKLGPDPLDPHAGFEDVAGKIMFSKKSIASLLMNQSVIAGIGNVYRAEILFRNKVNPFREGRSFSLSEIKELWEDAVYLLEDGSKDGRIRTVNFDLLAEDEKAVAGRYNSQFSYVYKRTGQPCRICTTIVAEDTVDGRTLYWCPTCQN